MSLTIMAFVVSLTNQLTVCGRVYRRHPQGLRKRCRADKHGKARRDQLRAFRKSSVNLQKLSPCLHILCLLAGCKTGGISICRYFASGVVGATLFSVCVGVVGEARHTAVINAVLRENVRRTGRPKGDTGKPPKGRRPTRELKITAGSDSLQKREKIWMMPLQHPCRGRVS